MDLYTLNENFLAKDLVDEFISAIWTERYSSAGDTQIVLQGSQENIDKLAPGTFLALRGSKEVMLLETQDIKDNTMTVVGKTLPVFFNERYAWFKNPLDPAADKRIVDYTETTTLGQFLANVINKMVIAPDTFGGAWAPADLNWPLEIIPSLTLGAIDTAGTSERQTFPIGPLYDGLAQLAEKDGLGFSVYLESADPVLGYSLKFKTYRGVERTGIEYDLVGEPLVGTYPLVRLVPEMDSISDLKEIHSISGYKNVAYVYYQGVVTKHLAEPTLPEPEGFARRILIVNPEGEPAGHSVTLSGQWGRPYTQTVVDSGDIAAFRAQAAKDALANHNYIRAIDGQTSPKNEYKFGIDYELGDIIELEGVTGVISKSRVTEYIRSQDQTGEKEYPTISVI